jgi:hypothetical protein
MEFWRPEEDRVEEAFGEYGEPYDPQWEMRRGDRCLGNPDDLGVAVEDITSGRLLSINTGRRVGTFRKGVVSGIFCDGENPDAVAEVVEVKSHGMKRRQALFALMTPHEELLGGDYVIPYVLGLNGLFRRGMSCFLRVVPSCPESFADHLVAVGSDGRPRVQCFPSDVGMDDFSILVRGVHRGGGKVVGSSANLHKRGNISSEVEAQVFAVVHELRWYFRAKHAKVTGESHLICELDPDEPRARKVRGDEREFIQTCQAMGVEPVL